MKKEMSAFALVLAAVLLFAYLFNLGPTGFVVNQQTSDLSGGTYSNTLYSSGAVVLNSSANATSGSYTSTVFDAGNSSVWDNLTWAGTVPSNSSLSFQVTTCSDANCSDANFVDATSSNNTIDLSSMNLTSQYFQYKVLFSRNDINTTSPSLTDVSYVYTPVAAQTASITIVSPQNTTYQSNQTTLDVTANENVSAWWYSLNGGNDTPFNGTSTITSAEGSNTITVYANNTNGTVLDKSVSYTVNTPAPCTEDWSCGNWGVCSGGTQTRSCTDSNSCGTTSTEPEVSRVCNTTQQQTPTPTPTPVVPPTVTKLTASSIAAPNVAQGDSMNMTFNVKNSGTTSLSGCALKLTGKYSSWFKVLDKSKSISPGQSVGFAFTASVPLSSAVGSYAATATVSCAQTSASNNFNINVQQKKLNVTILSVQRNRLDNVKVSYELSDLTGKDQNVSAKFNIVNVNKTEIGNASDTNLLAANATKDFSLNIPINSSAEGNMSLSGTFGSEKFSTTVLEPILLGAPVSGFAIGPLGTGSLAVVLGVIVVFVVLFFGVKRLRKKAKKKSASSERSSEEH